MIELQLNEKGDAMIETKDVLGQALDFWVCTCLGQRPEVIMARALGPTPYSSDWSLGGPLIHAQNIAISPQPPSMRLWVAVWPRPATSSKLILPNSAQPPAKVGAMAHHPLVAAMRAFVGGRFGTNLLVPKEYHENYRLETEAFLTWLNGPAPASERLQ